MLVTLFYIYLLAVQHVRGETVFSSPAASLVPVSGSSQIKVDHVYHSYDSLTRYLHDVNQKFPHLTYLYSVGKSTQGECSPIFIPSGPQILSFFIDLP